MGKPYGHMYFFAGSWSQCGTLQCAHCGKSIDQNKDDYLAYRKPTKDDWGFVCFHRKCYPDQSGWLDAEAKAAANRARVGAIRLAIDKLCADFGLSRGDLIAFLEDDE